MLTKTELNEKNFIKAINTKVIPAAAYPMNVCKRELRKCNMLGRQSSDERLDLKRDVGGRRLKSLRDAFV